MTYYQKINDNDLRNVEITIIQIQNFGCLTLENETRHENEVGNTSKPMSQRTKEVEVGSF